MSIKPGDNEYNGIDIDVSDPDIDYDEKGSPKPKLGANRRYDKFRGILNKDLDLKIEQQDEVVKEIFEDRSEIEDLQYLMKKRVGAPFVTNVLRVALNKEEEKIAR